LKRYVVAVATWLASEQFIGCRFFFVRADFARVRKEALGLLLVIRYSWFFRRATE
jgi:hypothetical protein